MRLLRNPRTRTRFGLTSVALAAGASMVLSASPAAAAPAGADLEYQVVGDSVVRFASKPMFVQLYNRGPAKAENIVVKVDVAGIDTTRLEITPPSGSECDVSGTVFTCKLGSLVPGQHENGFSPFDVTSIKVKAEGVRRPEIGPAGSFTVEVKSSTPDPNPENNKKQTVPVKVVPKDIDLFTFVEDVTDDGGRVKPGAKAPLPFAVFNFGTRTAHHVAVRITLPPFVTFPANENVRQCRYESNRTAATCEFRRILKNGGGVVFDPLLNVQVAKDAPGPVALTGGIIDGVGDEDANAETPVNPAAAPVSPDATDRALVAPAAAKQQKAAQANAASPSKDLGGFSVFTAANPADLAITGGSGHGTVGSTVAIAVKVKNNGPASSPHTTVKVTAPTGTELVGMPVGCVFETAGKVGKCTGPLAAGADATGVFSFKITAGTVGTNGKADISGTLADPVASNNSAAITITVDSGLPVTGAKVSAIAGAGVAVLLVGIGLFVIARRRRVVLVTPTEDR